MTTLAKPLALDLCCGMGGWTDGLLAAGFRVVGVDIYRHRAYAGELVLCDLLQFDPSPYTAAQLVVASPPCDDFARWGKPTSWFPKGRKQPDLTQVNRCYQIATMLAAPIVLENVRDAQPFLGTAVHHMGPYYLWGNGVPPLLSHLDRRIHKLKLNASSKITRAKIPFELAYQVASHHYRSQPA